MNQLSDLIAVIEKNPDLLPKLMEVATQQPEPPKTPWNPKGGVYSLNGALKIMYTPSSDQYCNAGTERDTQEAAERAAAIMRKHNRLLAYVDEVCGGHEFKVDGDNYFVYYDHRDKLYYNDLRIFSESPGTVYMPQQVAKELCEKLNSGEVVL